MERMPRGGFTAGGSSSWRARSCLGIAAARNGSSPITDGSFPSSPTASVWLALEGAHDLVGDPAAVETARLGPHPLAIDVTFHLAGVEAEIASDCIELRIRLLVAPSYDFDKAVAALQRPIAGAAFPLAMRASSAGDQQVGVHVLLREVKRRWACRLEHSYGVSRFGHVNPAMCDANQSCIGSEVWRPRIVPHRFLSRPGFDPPWGPLLAAMRPLASSMLDLVLIRG